MKKTRKNQGFLMIMALLLIVILVVLGFGFLGSRVGQYQSTGKAVNAAQARAVAYAGIEDVRSKMNLDIAFPPSVGIGQSSFTYSEDLTDTSGSRVGTYRITLDSSKAQTAPYFILSITSTGFVGPKNSPLATHTYRAFMDVSPILNPPSPTYFRIVRLDDLGERYQP